MKLGRSTPLRRTPLRSRPRRRPSMAEQEARMVWKTPAAGFCECGCQRFSMNLHRHHVLLAQIVRRENGNEWDLANGMRVHPDCHRRHHDAIRKIPLERVPEAALAFALDVLGEGGAAAYFRARYGC